MGAVKGEPAVVDEGPRRLVPGPGRLDLKSLPSFLGLTAAYWFLASLATTWANAVGVGSPIWPAAGVALAGLALGGVRLWPAIFLGRILTAWAVHSDNPPLVVLAIAAGNSLAAAAPIVMLRARRIDLRMSTLPDALWVLGAIAMSALVAASVGTGALAAGAALPASGAAATWRDWIYGNFAGGVAVMPLVLAWAGWRPRRLQVRSCVHLAGVLAFTASLGGLIYLTPADSPWRTWHIFPALVWAALAFQVRGASAAILIVGAMAVLGVSHGTGPFMPLGGELTDAPEVLIQQFIGLTGGTILLLAAAVDEGRAKAALRRSAEALTRQKNELETLYREAPAGMFLLDRDLRYQRINQVMADLNGIAMEAATGARLQEVTPRLAALMTPYLERVFTTGAPVADVEISGAISPRPDRISHWIFSGYPVKSGGEVQAVSCVLQDVTERREIETREHLLAREVDHRAKNLLAVIQGVVQLTRADDVAGFAQAVSGRIQALGRAHSLLAGSRWTGVRLQQLVDEEMAPFAGHGARLRIGGPDVQLRPAAAQSLALVIHELATNAAKYGSLSVRGGALDIAWRLDEGAEGGHMTLCWRERGGPPTTAPLTRGFGSTVLRSSVERQLKGKVDLDWSPDGLTCELILPQEQLVSHHAHPADAAVAEPAGGAEDIEGRRILVVEDEALVAMQIEQALADAGCTILGAIPRVDDALRLLEGQSIDAALLDINVAGEKSFPIADQLAERHIPFAFCTGYAASLALPERHRGVKVLPKPFLASQVVGAVEQLLHGSDLRHAP